MRKNVIILLHYLHVPIYIDLGRRRPEGKRVPSADFCRVTRSQGAAWFLIACMCTWWEEANSLLLCSLLVHKTAYTPKVRQSSASS